MKLVFWPTAWEDTFIGRPRIRSCRSASTASSGNAFNPFRGTGKPEPLGGDLKGWWSCRIDREHRLVYRVNGKGEMQALELAQCWYHY